MAMLNNQYMVYLLKMGITWNNQRLSPPSLRRSGAGGGRFSWARQVHRGSGDF